MTKLIFSTGLVLLSVTAFGQRDIDVLHYKYEIELSDRSDSIKAKATIQVKFNQPSDKFWLDLAAPNKAGKGMLAYKFLEGDNKSLSGKQTGNKLELLLSAPAEKDEIKSFTIEYNGIPADGLIISKTKYGHRSFFADNWPNRGHNWLPCVDDPADKATVEFIVSAPQHYQVVANGIQIEETNLANGNKRTHWKEEVPVATKVMVIGVADFAVNLAGTIDNCIPVYSWVYPEDRDKGFYDYAQANEILPFFIKHVGPYGYKKLANVQSKTTFGGLENANTIFYHENSINGQRRSEALMAHEIAHQWFGNMATEKSFAHLWLSEGFATYMTVLYMESKYGEDSARSMLAEDRREVIEYAKMGDRPVVDETKDFMQLLNPNSYQKGGWVLHMLRSQLGDSIFWKSIRNYYAAFAGKNADTKDLQDIVEKTSGKDLSQFFRQWLYTPGVPGLDIGWKYNAAEKNITLTVKQTQETPFSFPLDIAIKSGEGKSETKQIRVSRAEQSFSIPVKAAVKGIEPDPNITFLGEIRVKESK